MLGVEVATETKNEGQKVWESKDLGIHCIFGKHLTLGH